MKIFHIKKLSIPSSLLCLAAIISIPIQSSLADNIGVWNGFLDQRNVIELSNPENRTISVDVEIFNNDSSLINSNTYSLNARESKQIPLSVFNTRNAYGTYKLSSTQTDKNIPAITSIYRYSKTDGNIQYAYALEASTGMKGTSYGIFNSMNPEPKQTNVFNYLSIVNSDSRPFSATVLLYDQLGKKIPGKSFRIGSLASNARVDLDLTNIAGNLTGIYKIVPDNLGVNYHASLYRFSSKENGEFNFAFPLDSEKPSCNIYSLPLSTMNPATNWLEVANTSSRATNFSLEIFEQSGKLKERKTYTIAGNSHQHIYINSVLGESNSGFANISCDNNKPNLIAQSLFYGHSATNKTEVKWAYAFQGETSSFSSSNTKLFFIDRKANSASWLKNYSLKRAGDFEIHTFARSGDKNSKYDYRLAANNGFDISFHGNSAAGFFNNQSGLAVGITDSASIIEPGLLRVYSNSTGEITAIMNIPGIDVERSPYTSVRTSSDISTSSNVIICDSADSDPDGDGWGWENNQSCRVSNGNTSSGSTNTNQQVESICIDPDGDSVGYDSVSGEACEAELFTPETRQANAAYNETVCGYYEGNVYKTFFNLPYGNSYILQHNVWNDSAMFRKDFSLCVHLDGSPAKPLVSWNYNFHGEFDRVENSVVAYPQVYYGKKVDSEASAPKSVVHLPEVVNNLRDFNVEYKFYENNIGERNVALESFFFPSCNDVRSVTKNYEMMVWVDRPTTQQPGGFNDKLGEATIDGAEWEVWTNSSLSWNYLAYVRKSPSKSGTINWNSFVDYTVNEAHKMGAPRLDPNLCMSGIEMGTEIFWGQGDFNLETFKVSVQ